MPRLLEPLAVPAGERVLDLLPSLERALAGDGPALLLVPEAGGPPGVAASLGAGAPLEAGEDCRDDPTALVVVTSGSTGEPKGVLLGAAALRAAAAATQERLGGAPPRWLLALPVQHVGGLMVLVRSLLAGTEPVVLDRSEGFDASALVSATARVCAAPRPWCTALVPTQLARLLADADATAALAAYDAVLVGGAVAAPALLERARAAGVRVVATYGMTETCGGCVYDGVPLRGVQVATEPDGVVRLAGPVLARGYRRRPELTARAFAGGWFRTADLGRVDEAGRLQVVGRADDVIVTGGAKVAPTAVEAALSGHPAVRESAVFARADEQWGERVVAVVVPCDPVHPPALAALRAHVAAQAGSYAAPCELVVVDALPLLAAGKVDRAAVRTLRGEVWGA